MSEFQNKLKQLFEYNKETGELIWKVSTNSNVKIGDIAGSIDHRDRGYTDISIDGKRYKSHRLIWIWHFGNFDGMLDHIDTNRRNNKIENLRIATASQNNYNTNISKSNKSGIKGVYWEKFSQKWRVKIEANGKVYYFGRYSDLAKATQVMIESRKVLHGEFANSGM